MIVQWATLVGIIGVLGSLVFTGFQTRILVRQNKLKKDSAIVAADHGPSSMLQTVLVQFIQYPELRPYFFDSKPLPAAEPELSRVKATADLFADVLYAGLHASVILPGDGPNEAWCNYASDLLKSSPALRALWAEHAEWWPRDLADMLDTSGCVSTPLVAPGKPAFETP